MRSGRLGAALAWCLRSKARFFILYLSEMLDASRGSGSSSRKVPHEWLATLRENNIKQTTGIVHLGPQTIATAAIEGQ